jgi:8-hydroxy-5-deazaflavin:NADPH oxidoreductase
MNIAVIGSGNVGTALGDGFTAKGHNVVYGSTDPKKKAGSGRKFDSVAAAIAKSEVVVLAIPWGAVESVVGANDVSGKIVIDCVNPISPQMELVMDCTTSAGETVAKLAKGARVVKAFNTTGVNNMKNPSFGSTKLTMLYVGDDESAKTVVRQLISDIGFDPVDAGPLKIARYLEPLAMLWINLFFQDKHDIAFQLIKR